jgi:hexokinase
LLTLNRPLFNRISSEKLNTKGAVDLELVWDIDAAKNNVAVQQLLVKRLGLPRDSVTEEDGNTVKFLCRAILLRTARLGACAIASILILMGRAAVSGEIELGGRIGISGRSVITFKLWTWA